MKKEMAQIMKQIEVVAAIIRKDDKVFATQRGYGGFFVALFFVLFLFCPQKAVYLQSLRKMAS